MDPGLGDPGALLCLLKLLLGFPELGQVERSNLLRLLDLLLVRLDLLLELLDQVAQLLRVLPVLVRL